MCLLETSRLRIRRLTSADKHNLFAILSDSETMRYYPRPYTESEVAGWIVRSLTSYDDNGYGLWAVTLKDSGEFIGQCGITNQDIDGIVVQEIGYHIRKDHWNKGYATEAASACLAYGFASLKLSEIYIHTWIRNKPSFRVAEKLGMTRLKEYDKTIRTTGDVLRHVVYLMKRSDFADADATITKAGESV